MKQQMICQLILAGGNKGTGKEEFFKLFRRFTRESTTVLTYYVYRSKLIRMKLIKPRMRTENLKGRRRKNG